MNKKQPVIFIVEPYGGSARWHNPNLPMLFFDDSAVTRGDGVFESLLVRDGKPLNMQRHFDRFCSSAEVMDLAKPTFEKWEEATRLAVAEYGDGEARCTWTYTRGRASTGHPSCWVVVQPISDHVLEQREKGIKVRVAERGWVIPADLPAKTLNYAATMATMRQAMKKGFDDVIFTDPKTGNVLEGATSTVVSFKGKKLRTPASPGILPGTTQAALFDYASEHGWRCKAKEMSVKDLEGADSVWLVSSVRVATRVKQLGDHKFKAPDNEDEIRDLIEAALHH